MNMSQQAIAKREKAIFRQARKYAAKWLPIRKRENVEKGLYLRFSMTLNENNEVCWYYNR